jgi:hypothetical protein
MNSKATLHSFLFIIFVGMSNKTNFTAMPQRDRSPSLSTDNIHKKRAVRTN